MATVKQGPIGYFTSLEEWAMWACMFGVSEGEIAAVMDQEAAVKRHRQRVFKLLNGGTMRVGWNPMFDPMSPYFIPPEKDEQ